MCWVLDQHIKFSVGSLPFSLYVFLEFLKTGCRPKDFEIGLYSSLGCITNLTSPLEFIFIFHTKYCNNLQNLAAKESHNG